jgi:hypothetical protein
MHTNDGVSQIGNLTNVVEIALLKAVSLLTTRFNIQTFHVLLALL